MAPLETTTLSSRTRSTLLAGLSAAPEGLLQCLPDGQQHGPCCAIYGRPGVWAATPGKKTSLIQTVSYGGKLSHSSRKTRS
jgi:hypothetical protein